MRNNNTIIKPLNPFLLKIKKNNGKVLRRTIVRSLASMISNGPSLKKDGSFGEIVKQAGLKTCAPDFYFLGTGNPVHFQST